MGKKRAAWASTAPLDLEPFWETSAVPVDEAAKSAGSLNGKKFAPQLNALGSGSDYTAFLDHLGVPSLDAGFNGRYGVYHSIYDDFYWMEKFGDPEFLTHATAARLYTLIVMRAASAEVVPLKFVPYGEALRDYVDDLRRIVAPESPDRGVGLGQTADGL